MAEHNLDCMVCGTKLEYGTAEKEQVCIYCGGTGSSPIFCPKGHFVCDTCHSRDAIAFLEKLAHIEKSPNPMDVVDRAMTHPSFKFHGPEHHSLIPAAILIAMKNRGITRPDGSPITTEVVLEGINRGAKIPGGFCGYAGTCGACVGAGVSVALFVGATPTKGPERTVAHKATATALTMSQDDLRRCCKRATYYGMKTAMDILREEYGIDLGEPPELKSCKYSTRSRDCQEELCPFFGGE